MATPISSTDKSVLTSNNDPATVEETAQDLKEGLKTMLEESVEKVKGMADTLEYDYYKPAATHVHGFASQNPIFFTFFAIFLFFSAIPLLCFAGFVIFMSSILVSGAVVFLVMAISGVLFLSTTILFPILLFTSTLSILATMSLITLFLTTRLYILTRDNRFSIGDGLRAWMMEMKERIGTVQGKNISSDNSDEKEPEKEAKKENHENHSTEKSPGLIHRPTSSFIDLKPSADLSEGDDITGNYGYPLDKKPILSDLIKGEEDITDEAEDGSGIRMKAPSGLMDISRSGSEMTLSSVEGNEGGGYLTEKIRGDAVGMNASGRD